ncbi:hypothetical protein TVAG_310170 [Trichomonas vaginalis G3]|uniref:ELMO domain-containing protein n=1 Tax=Trichomonas vaginalis (strain ATCC PRA-98 / G3) TaxID=412133 RepID=A2EKT3_TRIV3|nr:ELMO domain-containing protein family [Trichomonas vaginalis G3]EAY06730.1 hypothetical protein TVAG_310170 [Trichomonas vaginalis G3]KAI5500976.1 ELMO domain-containing protein family [Trichomonas vaginalis G3]|eukprot:XP_001318953.1 hypothetical protein [Trichomonas vaginalis G3]
MSEPDSNLSDKKRVRFAPLPARRQSVRINEGIEYQEPQKEKEDKQDEDDSFHSDSDSSEQKEVPKEITEAKNQWNQIDSQQKQLNTNLPTEHGVGGTIIDRSSPITYYDASIYLINQSKEIECAVPALKFTSKSCFCFPKKPSQGAVTAFGEAYKICKIDFKEDDLVHHRILTSLHVALTGISTPPLRVGPHWEDVGFQSSDPITDLRASGMLGLLLPLGMLVKFKEFSHRIIRISRGDSPFPLMVVLIVYTKETVEAAETTDLLDGVNTTEEAWRRMLLYFTGLVNVLVTDWVRDFLCFNTDFNHFTVVAARGKLNPLDIVKWGEKAEHEDDMAQKPELSQEHLEV